MDDGDLDPGYVQDRVEDWINRLDDLLEKVGRWAKRCGHRVADGAPIFMREELMYRHGITTVEMPRLTLSSRTGRRVDLVPRGLWTIGVNGRVDIQTGTGDLILVDVARYGDSTGPRWVLYGQDNRDGTDFRPDLLAPYLRD